MATTTIVIAHNRDNSTSIAQKLQKTGRRVYEARALSTYFRALGAGIYTGSVSVQTDSTTAAAASKTITISYADRTIGDSITIGGVTLTTDSDWAWQTDSTVSAANLAAAINANATLTAAVVASSAAAVVTVTARTKSSLGNLVPISKSVTNANAITFTGTALTGGAGGTGTAQTYKYGVS